MKLLAKSSYGWVLAALCLITCTPNGPIRVPYEPVVVLAGNFDGAWKEFSGHLLSPNRCELNGDTVKMFLCTKDYSPGPDAQGAYIRLYIYTPITGALSSDTSLIGNRHLFVKMGLYTDLGSCSYEVSPADTLNPDWNAQFNANEFQVRRGGRIDFERGQMRGRAMDGFCPLPLIATDLEITGSIE